MNYYEELGVSQQATEQDIRKAHRRLVKLMHPDAQPDPSLKMVAETQMRRLNSIVSTLLDPEQRRLYDDQLRLQDLPKKQGSALAAWQGIPWWLASAVGAVVLTLVAVWLWADHLGNTFGKRDTVYVAPIENHPAVVAQPGPIPGESGAALSRPGDSGGISATVVSDPPPPPVQLPLKEPKHEVPASTPAVTIKKTPPSAPAPKPVPPVVAALPEAKKQPNSKETASKMASVQSDKVAKQLTPPPVKKVVLPASNPEPKPKRVFSFPAGSLIASAAPLGRSNAGQMPTPPGVSAQTGRDYAPSSLQALPLPAATPPKLPTVTTSASSADGSLLNSSGVHDPLEGEWVYAPREPERRRAGFYPPEYIDLKLFGSGDPGNLRGQYSAKYVVTDRPVSPEISFQLASVSKGSRRFVWQSNDGARGTLSIDPIDERTIRIDWHTTTGTRGPALTSGQATLIRRQ